MSARPIQTDPNAGIPDLIHRLSDDGKRLVSDEIRLAKIEAKDSLKRATRGVLWMTVAFGAAVIMFVALTLFVATFIGRLANGHMWVGALVTGLLELAAGAYLIKRGIGTMTEPSYSLEASRQALADTAHWAAKGTKHDGVL